MRHTQIVMIAVCLFLAGCGGEVDRQSAYDDASIQFAGYDSASLEQVKITRYDGNNRRVDSTLYLLSASPTALHHYDDSAGYVLWPYQVRIRVGQDWEISVPGAGKSYRISGLTLSDGKAKKGGMGEDDRCTDVITGYYLNGSHVSTGLVPSRVATRAEIWLPR